MLFVYTVRLYAKMAATMTSKMGQIARATPSKAAVPVSRVGMSKAKTATIAAITTAIGQAL